MLDSSNILTYISGLHYEGMKRLSVSSELSSNSTEISTKCYNLTASFENENFNVRLGKATNEISNQFKLFDVDGIIGCDFFSNFKFMLNYEDKTTRYIRIVNYKAKK